MAKKGDRVILPCEFKARDIFHIRLNRQSKHILVHQNKYCSKRACRQGACDIIIKDLRLRDAGKYFLEIYYIHAKSVLDPQIKTYQLHIYGKVKSDQIICMCFLVFFSNCVVLHATSRDSEWDKLNIQISHL